METKDYEKDGILYCGICNKPKERRSAINESEIIPSLCDCQGEARDQEQGQWQAKQRMMKIADMRTESIKDKERRNCRFEVAEENEYVVRCKQYVDQWEIVKRENIGLMFWGPCGNGKSFCAACIANALIDRGIPSLMTSLPAILSDQNNIMEIVRQMKEYELVVIDDLGAERQSEYALEKTFLVIDERYKTGKPLIVTTNQKYQDMKEMRDKGDVAHSRIYDRILDMCTPIAFSEANRRREPQKRKREILKEVFANTMAKKKERYAKYEV